MPDLSPGPDYVFGYASLVGLREPLLVAGVEQAPLPGRLCGFRRFWGAAMNNWEGGDAVKHFLDRGTGERPRIRVAYLDIEPNQGSAVNGLAIPVDAARLAALDAREVNYSRIDVSASFESGTPQRVFAYVGTEAARGRCRQGTADGDVFVSGDYLAAVRAAFAALGSDVLAELDRTIGPLPFPERDLKTIPARRAGG